MSAAFQSHAFQNNAFQIGIATTGGGNVFGGGGGHVLGGGWHSIPIQNATVNGAMLTALAILIPGSATFVFDGELLDADLMQLP